MPAAAADAAAAAAAGSPPGAGSGGGESESDGGGGGGGGGVRRVRHKAVEQRRRGRTKDLLRQLQDLVGLGQAQGDDGPGGGGADGDCDPGGAAAASMNDVLARAVKRIGRLPGRGGAAGAGGAAPAARQWCGGCGECRDCEEALLERLSEDPPPPERAEDLGAYLADIVPALSVALSPEPGGGYRVDYVSTACRAATGFERREVRGRPVLDFIHPDDAPAFSAALAAAADALAAADAGTAAGGGGGGGVGGGGPAVGWEARMRLKGRSSEFRLFRGRARAWGGGMLLSVDHQPPHDSDVEDQDFARAPARAPRPWPWAAAAAGRAAT